MNNERLTDELATRVMGWRLAPGRYIKSSRNWTPRWRFAPLTNLVDAIRLLDAAAPQKYTMHGGSGGSFLVRVQIGAETGEAQGQSRARAITCAIARALAIDVAGVEGLEY